MSDPAVKACVAGEHFSVTGQTIIRLHDLEGLPAIEVCRGPHGRRTLRFRINEVEKWFATRRENQILATVNGERFTRRRPA